MLRACSPFAALIILVPSTFAGDGPKKTAPPETTLHVRLLDDSVVKLALLDENIEIQTPYGKLTIAAREIRKIEVGLRIPEDVAALIRQAVADLGSAQTKRRDDAAALLLKYREKSFPTLKEAIRTADADVTKRIEELLEKIEELAPDRRVEVPEHDVIHTDRSQIAGRILLSSLRVRSFAFGDLTLKLSDVQAMSAGEFKPREVAVAGLPDPGSLTAYRQPQQVGKTYTFKVTGAVGGSVWGTGTYTLDSSLAAAAVHMGIVKVGQTGNVKVTILGPTVGFVGSNQNGVVTSNYDSYPGAFQIHPK